MTARRECVAGFGQLESLWFIFENNQFIGYSIETPDGVENVPVDEWAEHHLLVIRTTAKHGQRGYEVLPYLTMCAAPRAIRAIRDYDLLGLAVAFTSHHSWQLINGAKILPDYGEIAKVYAGGYAVYLFRTAQDKQAVVTLLTSETPK